MNNQSGGRTVVVGGGVIGAMCAWYLNKAGHEVTIVDKDRFGAACSHGNCGYVCPSHVLPLPQPGAIKNALPSLFRSNSPLSIRWRWSPALWSWLWKFSRRCNRSDMMAAAQGRSGLLNLSKDLFQQLISSEGIECEWRENGLLFVFRDESHFNHYGQTNDMLVREFGVEAQPFDSAQLNELEPSLVPGLGGGWLYRGDCHLRPDKLMAALKQKLVADGVKIVEGCAIERFENSGGKCRSVIGDQGEFKADHFVVATGAWTPFLNERLGCNIQIQPGKGYSITMPHPELTPKYPMVLEQHRVAITPMETKYRIGSTMEFAGYDTSIDPSRLQLLKDSSALYLRQPHCEPVEEQWFGWRPMTWDGKPTIDRSPAMKNVIIAAGHNMLGLSMAPGTGKLVQQCIDGQSPEVDLQHYSLKRLA